MKSKDLYLDNHCLGEKMLLVSVTPDLYINGQRLAEPIGFKYEVCLRAHDMDKLSVKIPGPQQMDAPLPEADVLVRFDGLTVRPYVAKNGRLAFTSSATAIRPAKGENPAQPKG